MTKEEILKQYPSIEIEGINVVASGISINAMQHYADQETESLRQQNAKLVEALKAILAQNEQDPNNPERWWSRCVPTAELLNNALKALQQ